jgi:hypothetical protein
MPAGSAQLQQGLRSGSVVRRVSTATFRNPFTGATTPPLPILAGSDSKVTIDIDAVNRRVLTLALPPSQSLFDTVAVPGGEITVTQTVLYLDRSTEVVPLGVFCVTQQGMTYQPGGQLSLTCPDRWFNIQACGFDAARTSISSNTGSQEIKRLMEGAWSNAGWPFPGWAAGSPDMGATTKVGPLVWADGDRNNATQGLLKLNSYDAYFDANGLAVLRPIPILTAASVPVWVVNPGETGVLIDAERIRDGSVVRNVIVVSTSASDVILPIQVVANTHDPNVDPLSSLGPLGRRTMQYSDNFRATPQMIAAGKVQLNKQLSAQQQLTLTARSNPWLDGYDVITGILPKGDATTQPVEQHLVATATIPLTPAGQQQITVRSTRISADDTV